MKQIRFLLGNNTLSLLAGSETWTYTLAMQLKKMGHIVHCFSPELGIISQKLEDAGIHCFSDLSVSGVKPFSIVLEEKIDHAYDVIIANHNHIVKFLRGQFPNTPIISPIHGIIHTMEDGVTWAPEHPAIDSGVQQFVAVSEEIQSLLKESYGIDSLIIRNFVDTDHYKSKRKISKGKPKQILLNTNYFGPDDEEVKVLREVAKHYGAKLAAIGMNFAPEIDPMKAIESSDLVFGMGRSVLEALSAGRLGFVYGRWGGAELLNDKNIEEIRSTNFSGRIQEGTMPEVHHIIEAIDLFYDSDTAAWGRNYVLRDHNVVHAAEMFVSISRDLMGENMKPVESDGRRPYRKASNVNAS